MEGVVFAGAIIFGVIAIFLLRFAYAEAKYQHSKHNKTHYEYKHKNKMDRR